VHDFLFATRVTRTSITVAVDEVEELMVRGNGIRSIKVSCANRLPCRKKNFSTTGYVSGSQRFLLRNGMWLPFGDIISEAREGRVLIVGSHLVHRPFTSAFRRSAYVDENCTD
jgi:hypothetical protein